MTEPKVEPKVEPSKPKSLANFNPDGKFPPTNIRPSLTLLTQVRKETSQAIEDSLLGGLSNDQLNELHNSVVLLYRENSNEANRIRKSINRMEDRFRKHSSICENAQFNLFSIERTIEKNNRMAKLETILRKKVESGELDLSKS